MITLTRRISSCRPEAAARSGTDLEHEIACSPELRRPRPVKEDTLMSTESGPERGEIWRNIHGAYVIIGDPGYVYHDGQPHEVLWVQPCTEDGTPFGGPVPMNPPTQDSDGFPGNAWEFTGQTVEPWRNLYSVDPAEATS